MMQNHDYELETLRREHMMQKAQERRQADQYLAESKNNRGIMSPTLAGMGRVLSNIGDGLQQRYGENLQRNGTTGVSLQTESA